MLIRTFPEEATAIYSQHAYEGLELSNPPADILCSEDRRTPNRSLAPNFLEVRLFQLTRKRSHARRSPPHDLALVDIPAAGQPREVDVRFDGRTQSVRENVLRLRLQMQ